MIPSAMRIAKVQETAPAFPGEDNKKGGGNDGD
jgi:hypothetical protein